MTIEQRVGELEREVVGLRRLLVAAGLMCLAVVSMAATPSPEVPEVLRARSLQIIDEDGKPRVSLSQTDGIGEIEVGTGHRTLVRLGGEERFGEVVAYDHTGRELVRLGSDSSSGAGLLQASSADGRLLVKVGGGAGDAGAVLTYGAGGAPMVALAGGGAGGFIQAFDSAGELRFELPTPASAAVPRSAEGDETSAEGDEASAEQ